MTLRPVATTADGFRSFGPYVAAIDAGRVVFTATLDDGRTALVAHDGDRPRVLLAAGEHGIAAWESHPDLDARGRVSAYARLADGRGALVRVGDGVEVLAVTGGELGGIGPLGPTVAPGGAVAFRAWDENGEPAAWVWDGGLRRLTPPGAFAGLEGLPVINAAGTVLLRVVLPDGRAALALHDGARLDVIVAEGGGLRELGRFPDLGDDGRALFVGADGDGHGVFDTDGEGLRRLHSAPGPVRGAIGAGGQLWYATPYGGTLGVYDATGARLLGLGDRLEGGGGGGGGGEIVDFALNPVSIDRDGAFVVRVRLAGGREGVWGGHCTR